jgi:hypothetical protein
MVIKNVVSECEWPAPSETRVEEWCSGTGVIKTEYRKRLKEEMMLRWSGRSVGQAACCPPTPSDVGVACT